MYKNLLAAVIFMVFSFTFVSNISGDFLSNESLIKPLVDSSSTTPVPEPAAMLLLGFGLIGLSRLKKIVK